MDKLAIKLGGGGHKKVAGFNRIADLSQIIQISKEYIRECKTK